MIAKSLLAALALLIACYLGTSVADPDGRGVAPQITIDQILANDRISGYVRGLVSGDYGKYKVVVYVHTDKWYIHPFAAQGEGMSWALINPDGTWQIKTTQREFRSSSVAALLVDRQYPEPNMIADIRQIPARAIVIKDLRGTADEGKL